MESTRLAEFYRHVSKWPKTDADCVSVAEQVSALLGHPPFVVLYGLEPEEHTGFYFPEGTFSSAASAASTLANAVAANGHTIGEYLKRLGSDPSFGTGLPKQIHLAREGLPRTVPWSQGNVPGYLVVAPILREFRVEDIGDEKARKPAFGIIAAGSAKASNASEEALLVAGAQRLSGLAEISQYEMALQTRSQFLSIASHELKTPLTSIYGMLQLQERLLKMKRDEPVAQQQERQLTYLRMVIRQVERLNELIDGLLDVSRIQNGRFMVEPTDIDVAVVLRDTITSRLDLIAKEAGVRLQLEAPSSLMARVDPVRLEELITNLGMNAIRFSPEGGMVWIKLHDDGTSFRISFRDQGPSVAKGDRERIFLPFERAQRTARLGGLGLGLFISRQIAQLHGGNVSLVESVAGTGNVFEASFPNRGVQLISA